jgi:hypothetical protein
VGLAIDVDKNLVSKIMSVRKKTFGCDIQIQHLKEEQYFSSVLARHPWFSH